MPLERQSIEKKDFPIGRRGYDPEAVDAHLAAIADQVDELRRSSRRRTETLASAASEQVRAIVEAAETSAAEIQRQAEEEAAEVLEEARREAQEARRNATAQAREYLGRVTESTTGMQQRIDAMESELSALLESLRTGANRLNADLQLVEGNLAEVRESVAPHGGFEPEEPRRPAPAPRSRDAAPAGAEEFAPAAQAGPAAGVQAGPAAGVQAGSPAPPAPAASPGPAGSGATPSQSAPSPAGSDSAFAAGAGGLAAAEEPARPTSGAGAAEDDEETEAARLIALNMALNGTPREETRRYLSDNFDLPDADGLLEEVYSSVEE